MTIEPWMVTCAVVFFMAASFHLGVKFGCHVGFKIATEHHSDVASELLLDIMKELPLEQRLHMREAALRVHEKMTKVGFQNAIQKRSATS